MKPIKIDEKVIKEHGLSPDEYSRIVELMGRDPNMVELGIFSVMWSEHCSYKSSRMHLKNLPTTGEAVIQGPGENAGIVDIGDGMAAVFKMESHNHPSYIEPYQGAATGVGGIMRDIFTMGARPVASLNSLRFGSFYHDKTAYLVEGVTAGIAGYGNCMGVPTVGGEVYFNDCYNGNNLVNVMNVGLVKTDRIFKGYASGIGNPVMYVGSKTGRDGIHGATMASDVFGEGGEERRPTVQVGDPFAEKLLLEACLELFKTDYVVGIQDMGAAGLTSSSVEMADRAGTGLEIDIDKIPRREEGMTAYECMLSESQERMLVVTRAGVEDKVVEIFEKWDLDVAVIGTVVEGSSLTLIEGGEVVAEMPISALTEEAPVYDRPSKRPEAQDSLLSLDVNNIMKLSDYNQVLMWLLSSGEIASKEWIYRQYDHMVRTDTTVLPGSDASVIRVKGTDKGLAMTVDCNSVYCLLDPRTGASIAVAEAARNLTVSGARPLALTDCLNFGNPEKPEVMWQIKEALKGIADACNTLEIPVIGGNVSLYNETSGNSIHPTPTIGMVGLIDDIKETTTQWFPGPSKFIYLITPKPASLKDGEEPEHGLGGSVYLRVVHGLEKGPAPRLELAAEKVLQKACLKAIKAGIIVSAHDVSEGGLAVAIAECCMHPEKPIGAFIKLDSISEGVRPDTLLFGETQSRIIVSVEGENEEALKELITSFGLSCEKIGVSGGANLKIGKYIDVPAESLKKTWSGALESFLTSGAPVF